MGNAGTMGIMGICSFCVRVMQDLHQQAYVRQTLSLGEPLSLLSPL